MMDESSSPRTLAPESYKQDNSSDLHVRFGAVCPHMLQQQLDNWKKVAAKVKKKAR